MNIITIKSKYSPIAILVALIMTIFGLSLFAMTAVAHGPEILAKASPPDGAELSESPSQITMVFTAALKTEPYILEVYDLDGNQVDNKDAQVDSSEVERPVMTVSLPTLNEGVYMVRWSVSPIDGDVVNGLHFFSVGKLPDNTAGQLSSGQNTRDSASTTSTAIAQPSTTVRNDETRSPLLMTGGAAVATAAGIIVLGIIGIGIYSRRRSN